MFDYTILDGRTFEELNGALDVVRKKIGEAEDELEEGEDSPLIDALYAIADNIIKRMDSIVREFAHDKPALSAQWGKVMRDYEFHYDKYTDHILEDDTLIDLDSPEDS